MKRHEAKELILSATPTLLQRDRNGKGYICPICGSGSGRNGTGITTRDGLHFACWRGCFTHADIIDIIGMEYHLTSYNDKLRKCCELIGIDSKALQADQTTNHRTSHYQPLQPLAERQDKPRTDYTDFYKACMGRIDECDYLQRRGISGATTKPFPLGYCPNWQNPEAIEKGYNPRESPRLIIPLTRYSYFARDIRPTETLSEYERRFIKINVGQAAIFNRKALATATEPIFITEGAIDALSIIEAGHIAIGLGGVDKSKLIQAIEEYKPTQPFIISLDGDKAGTEASAAISDALKAIQTKHIIYSISDEENKDPNAMLVNEPELFKKSVEKALEICKEQFNRSGACK